MSDESNYTSDIDAVADEFARRLRSGERPSVEDYAARHPGLADQLRDILPAVAMMEHLKPRRDHAPTRPAPDVDLPPNQVGEYRIVRELGRGGMGVVYEAEHGPLGRRVALKVLPGHLLSGDRLRDRFRREATAAARLHHTNIVPVFEAGEADGRCFYAMPLITGAGLDQVIRDRAAGATGKSPALARLPAPEYMRAVAKIGAQVADALAYAHGRGVYHRDIKPSNLLVDERGGVWVTDFGVAKLVAEANLTHTGDLVGTLRYMPPERFAGQTDPRGDIYSLGVTLYELLTLHPAFPEATPHHLMRLITHEDPVRPRWLNSAIPADLETVILKAAARDPADRYQTPGELADDLRRFLDDRPVRAKRANPADRACRWARRNPALATALGAVFLLMAAVTVVSVIAFVVTSAANREAGEALQAEKQQREHAEKTAALALGALNRTYDRFAPARLVAAPTDTTADGIELPPRPPAVPPDAVALLEDLVRTYEQVARAGERFPALLAQVAEANHRLGDIHRRLGHYPAAARAYQSAVEQYARLAETAQGDGDRVRLARAYNEYGRTLRLLYRPDKARQAHQQAIRTLADGPAPSRPECRYELAYAYYALAEREMFLTPLGPPRRRGSHRNHRRPTPPGDRPPGRQAVALLEPLVAEFPTVPEYRHLLARCLRNLPPDRGTSRSDPPADRAVSLLRQLVTDFSQVPDYQLDLCEILARPFPSYPGESTDDRLTRQREAARLAAELTQRYPSVPEYTAIHARCLDQVGLTLIRAGQLPASEAFHRQAVERQSRLVEQHPEVAAYGLWLGLMERSLGDVLGKQENFSEATHHLQAAIARIDSIRAEYPQLAGVDGFLGLTYRNLAEVLKEVGDQQAATTAEAKAREFGRRR